MNKVLSQAKSDILKALAHPIRIRILEYLRDGEKCVCEIMREINVEQSNVSQHLSHLKKVNILDSKKEGLKVIYRVKNDEVFQILNLLDGMIYSQMERNIAILNGLKKSSCR